MELGQFYVELDTDTYAKPDESVPRDEVETSGISDNLPASSGGYFYKQNMDAYARSNEPLSRDGVKTSSVSSDVTSSPERFYCEQHTNPTDDLAPPVTNRD